MSGEVWKNKGNDFFKVNNYHQAAKCYLKAIDCEPTNAIYHSNLAACSIGIGDYRQAAAQSEQSIILNPSYEKAYFRAIQAYSEMLEVQSALELLRKCYQMVKKKNNGVIPTDIEKTLEQKSNEVRRAIVRNTNSKRKKKMIMRDGKFDVKSDSIADFISKAALGVNSKKLSMDEIFDLISDFELEDLEEVDSFMTAKNLISNSLNPKQKNEPNVGYQKTVDEKYIKKDSYWYCIVEYGHGLVDAADNEKFKYCEDKAERPVVIQVIEVTDRGTIVPLAIESTISKHKHKKFGYGLQILRTLALAIITSYGFSSSSDPAFLPERFLLNGIDFFKSKAEAIIHYGIITHLPCFGNMMVVSMESFYNDGIGKEFLAGKKLQIPPHPFVRSKGLKYSCELRGENFTLQMGHNIFEALAELASLEPWKYISTLYPLHISIRHSQLASNYVQSNASNLKSLLKHNTLGIEGLDYMDGRERILCIMGNTDPNATGFSILNSLNEFSTFVTNPNLVPEIPSVQYGPISNISMDDLDDIKMYNWPVYKGKTRMFYPFIVTILKNFFNTTDEKLLRRSELKDLKWMEAAARGLVEFMKKCVKHPPIRGITANTNFLNTEESTKTGFRVQTTDGEAFVRIIVGHESEAVKLTTFYAETDEDAYEQFVETTKAWKAEMENEKPVKKSCLVCGASKNDLGTNKKLLLCGKCKKVYYCSRDCQQQDWPTHKKVCKKEIQQDNHTTK